MSGVFGRLRRGALIGAGLLAAGLVASPGRAADTVTVHVDHAYIMRLPERAATLVLGNPLVADIALQKGGILVVTGKGYGATNLVMLDRSGNTVSEKLIQVVGPGDRSVVVYRQMERQTLSCTPECEPRANLGDSPTVFGPTLDQINSRNGGAQGAGIPAGPASAAPR